MTLLSRGRRSVALFAVVATTIVVLLLLLATPAPSTAQPSNPAFEYFDVGSVTGKPKTAAWSPRTELQVFRTWGNIEYYKQVGANGVQIMTAPPGSFLLMGGTADVWISTDGFDWYILSGPATASLGYIPNWLANTFPFSYGQCYAKDRNSDRLYVMRDNYVWISPNGGKNWTVNNAAGTGSNRAWFSCMVDTAGVLYNIAGASTYISTNQGQSWTYKSDSPWQFKGRVGQSGGTYFSTALNADLIYIMGGGRPALNDVWVTRDGATTWVQLSANAPWPARYDSRFAATTEGVLIVAGGRPDDSNSFNDVWTSVDGGYNWWLLRNHASFSPRGLPAMTVDRDGYLWIFGGVEYIYVGNIPQWTNTNKISKSTHSFNSQQLKVWGPKVARGMYSGTCLGLVCWPLEECRCSDTTAPADFNFRAQTLNAPFQPRFNGHIRELAHTMQYYGRDANGAITTKTASVGSFVFYGGMNASWMGVSDGWLASSSLATWEPMFGPAAAAIGISSSTYSVPTMSPGQAHCSKSLPTGSRFYSIGGDGQGNVWTSTNNREWSSVNTGFSDRSYGMCGVTDTMRVWHFKWDQLRYSDNNGVSWITAATQRQPFGRDAGFGGSYFSALLDTEVIYLSGGISNGYNYNDLWYTTDWGVTWYMTTSAAAWAARADAAAVVDSNGVMVIMAGQAGGFRDWFNDAWFTADGGYTWHELTSADAISTRAFPSVAITAAGRIVSVAGNRENGGYSNDAYISDSAYLLPNILTWGPLVAPTFKVDGTCRGLYCLSGETCRCGRRATNMFDIKPVVNVNAAPFTPRFNIALFRTSVAHNWPALRQVNGVYTPVTLNDPANSWIVYGGGVGVADVWVSTNKGVSWECIAGVPGNPAIPNGFWDSFKDREGQGMCKDPYNDKLYIMGGKDPSSGAATAWLREVWSATDGQDWLQIQAGTADGPGVWPGRAYLMCSVDTKGRLYATGGNDDGYGLVDDDTYVSQDGGATWTLVNTKVTYPPRAAFFGGSHYGRLQGKSLIYAIGGISFRNFNDVWVTSDGAKTWALITATAPWAARADATVAFSDSGVIVLYGGQLRSFDRFLSDTWMSLDGGFNWWQVAPFTTIRPRSYAGTLIDESGYLWVIGGNMMWTNVNDVYRSTLQFTDSEIARWGPALNSALVLPKNAAGVNTFGLACWPGQACKYDIIPPNYSGYGIPDADDGSGTGVQCPDQAASSSSSGLSGGAIAGIVIGVIVGVVVIAALLLALVRGRSDKGSTFGSGGGGSKFTPQHDVEMSQAGHEEPAETA